MKLKPILTPFVKWFFGFSDGVFGLSREGVPLGRPFMQQLGVIPLFCTEVFLAFFLALPLNWANDSFLGARVMRFRSLFFAGLIVAGFSGPAVAGQCKISTAEGWGPTEGLAKLQATDMLLLATGKLIVQSDKFSKPKHSCSFTLLGWTCKATAKVCKK